jgi:hypothetical protein
MRTVRAKIFNQFVAFMNLPTHKTCKTLGFQEGVVDIAMARERPVDDEHMSKVKRLRAIVRIVRRCGLGVGDRPVVVLSEFGSRTLRPWINHTRRFTGRD